MELKLRIILEKPVSGVVIGLQEGSGSFYQTIQKQQFEGKDLLFEFTLKVKSETDEFPVFLGAMAQGSPKERFVYLDIGTAAGQFDSIWSRRLKVPLKSITWEMIHQMQSLPQAVLEIKVPGTAKDGSPGCATVKTPEGWKIVQ
ncbi:DUF5990 family protein [Runella sp.]|uniref:DUF5990 family protein n=1 Tax=Runella sp. TaxID=1960881 RepID=UPI003D131D11